MIDLEKSLIEKLRSHFGADLKRVHHAKKVLRYAKEILKKEKGNYDVVVSAAILHDIGLKECERKYNSTDGHLHEKEGPPIAREMLNDLKVDENVVAEVCEIIASHHSQGKLESQNFKVLWDADNIVNIKNKTDIKDKGRLRNLIDDKLYTATGKSIAYELYLAKQNPFTSLRIQPYRRLIQFVFMAIIVWIGIEFIQFVFKLKAGMLDVYRPPGVEAFLPISALISLKHWILSSKINHIHPSGLIILLVSMGTGLLLKKGLCGWVCPFGLINEYLGKIHKIIFKRRIKISEYFDYPLRSIKYLLLLFFLWAIFVKMDYVAIERFVFSPYNKIADVKMLKFFIDPSIITIVTISIILMLTVFIPNFWCRYLCPYGALVGGLSLFSLFKIHRAEETCINCRKCTRSCPNQINVHVKGTVFSDECNACLNCVDVCPVKSTLFFSLTKKHIRIPQSVYAILLVLFFVIGIGTARYLGYWENNISNEEYRFHINHLSLPVYQHHKGKVPDYDGNYLNE